MRLDYRIFMLGLFLSVSLMAADEAPEGDTKPTSSAGNSSDIRPCSFQNVTPGETTVEEALVRLGTPTGDENVDGLRRLTFELEPFQKAELIAIDGVISSIVLHFKTPALPTQIEYELDLRKVESTAVMSETGQLLGRAYPERAVLLNFDPAGTSHRATQLILEPVTAELFLLRVRNDSRHRYSNNLRDLNVALKLEPRNHEALCLRAEKLKESGQYEKAMKAVDQALEQTPLDARLSLTKAELLLQLDRLDEARDLVKGLVDDRPDDPVMQARVSKLYGDVLAQGAARNFATALEHHMEAIQFAAPAATDPRVGVRRAAKSLLVDTFLAAAYDIAAGEWQDKEVTAGKWLASARELADATIVQETGDESLRMIVALGALGVEVEVEVPAGPALDTTLAALAKEAQRAKDSSGDSLYQREVDLLRARGLFDAATIAHRRDRAGQARELAAQAIKLIDPLLESREFSPSERYMIGRLHFFAGSAVAVSQQDHRTALQSYQIARKFLANRPPAVAAFDLERHGERLVSMGASYFEAGEKETGVKLTRDGVEIIREAVAAGMADENALSLPYSNLAAMYKVLGQDEEAREVSEIASRRFSNSAKRR